jgi:hypothetical protein
LELFNFEHLAAHRAGTAGFSGDSGHDRSRAKRFYQKNRR